MEKYKTNLKFKTMKVFEIKFTKLEKSDFVAAETIIGALQEYCSTTEMDLIEFEKEDEIIEVPENKWKNIIIIDEFKESDNITVDEFMQTCAIPCVICVAD